MKLSNQSAKYLFNLYSQIALAIIVFTIIYAVIYLNIAFPNKLVIIFATFLALFFMIFYFRHPQWHQKPDFELGADLIFTFIIFAIFTASGSFGPWFLFCFYILAIADAVIYSYRHLLLTLLLLSSAMISGYLINDYWLDYNVQILFIINLIGLWALSHFIWYFAINAKTSSQKGLEAQITAKKIEELEKRRTEFIHLAAHQLKNPLAIIRFILLEQIRSEKSDKKTLANLNQAIFQSDIAIAFIDDINRIIKAESKAETVQKENIDIELLIKEILAEQANTIKVKKIQIIKNFGGIIPLIETDRLYLKIALTNVIDNAIKYSREESRIIINTTLVANNRLKIEVQDFGIGIALADKSRIFEKFFRGDNAKKLVANGTGLGLYLVQSILSRLKGEIIFVSTLNKGTSFLIELPVK